MAAAGCRARLRQIVLTHANIENVQMNRLNSGLPSRGLPLAASLLIVASAAQAAEPTLKDAYKDAFHVGVAINRTIALGEAVQADNVNRTLEQVQKDATLVTEQFNQISPENDL